MISLHIRFYNVMHKYKVTSDAVNIYSNPDNLVKSIQNDLNNLTQSIESDKDNAFELSYITYVDMMFKYINSIGVYIAEKILPKDLVDYFRDNPKNFILENYVIIDGYDNPIKIKDFSSMMNNYDTMIEYSYNSTKNRIKTNIDDLRDEYLNKIADPELSIKDKAMIVSVIGNTYDLTESIIDDNKEDLSDKMTEEIKNIRYEYENIENPENEWEFVNKQVETLLKDDKELVIRKCTYNGKEIEYDDLVRKLLSHVFPQYLTQVDIMTTLDDYYIIETDKCKIIRSIGGGIRIERVHEDEQQKES